MDLVLGFMHCLSINWKIACIIANQTIFKQLFILVLWKIMIIQFIWMKNILILFFICDHTSIALKNKKYGIGVYRVE